MPPAGDLGSFFFGFGPQISASQWAVGIIEVIEPELLETTQEGFLRVPGHEKHVA